MFNPQSVHYIYTKIFSYSSVQRSWATFIQFFFLISPANLRFLSWHFILKGNFPAGVSFMHKKRNLKRAFIYLLIYLLLFFILCCKTWTIKPAQQMDFSFPDRLDSLSFFLFYRYSTVYIIFFFYLQLLCGAGEAELFWGSLVLKKKKTCNIYSL